MWCCPKCRNAAEFADPQRPWPYGWICRCCGFALDHRDCIPCLGPDSGNGSGSYDPTHFKMLAPVEEMSFFFVNRAMLIVRLLKRYFPYVGTLLEIGCGTGSILLALRMAFPQIDLAGGELFPEGLEFARKRLNSSVLLLQMDARAIPAISEFDVIGAFDVLEHIEEDEPVIGQIYAALKPGGGTIIAVPQHPWLWSPTDYAAHHQRRYTRGELEGKLEGAGFRILHSTSFMSLLIPIMIVSRIWLNVKARRGKKVAALSELQVPAWLNRTLSAIVRFEVALTSAGIKWPIGGSRFVVAQRPE